MKRITIVSVLALFSAVAATGCLGQTSGAAGTDESTLVSQRTHEVVNPDPRSADYNGAPAQALELKTHSTDDGQGPSPEPWMRQEGPSPEPWQGKKLMTEPDPNPSSSGTKP
jgi:hypothetical protein